MTFWVRQKMVQDEKHIITLQQKVRNSTTHLKLDQILQHPFGYELFMQHLSNEFSIENLLSLTEFIQYKCKIKQELDITAQASPGQTKLNTNTSEILDIIKLQVPTSVDCGRRARHYGPLSGPSNLTWITSCICHFSCTLNRSNCARGRDRVKVRHKNTEKNSF